MGVAELRGLVNDPDSAASAPKRIEVVMIGDSREADDGDRQAPGVPINRDLVARRSLPLSRF